MLWHCKTRFQVFKAGEGQSERLKHMPAHLDLERVHRKDRVMSLSLTSMLSSLASFRPRGCQILSRA